MRRQTNRILSICVIFCCLLGSFMTRSSLVRAEEEETRMTAQETAQDSSQNTAQETREIAGITSPCVFMMEASTGKVIYEKNADQKMHPASVTKVMTLLLIFEAIEKGQIKMDDLVTVSEYAASMGGSQVFLEAGEQQTVDTMIKCIAVASANDACVAMAEYLCGTEEEFVKKMNVKAQELNMNHTHFVNCCGLDDALHLTTARDIAIMSQELTGKYPEIYKYSGIWMDTITHTTRRGSSTFGLSNTNKLMKQYEWATGLKTGSTSQAGCCLAATAKKDELELIVVVLAAPSSKNRFSDAISLFNYGYNICKMYQDDTCCIPQAPVKSGKKDSVQCELDEDFKYLFTTTTDFAKIEHEVQWLDLEAPVEKGQILGKVVYYLEGKELGSADIVAKESVNKWSVLDSMKTIYYMWMDFI